MARLFDADTRPETDRITGKLRQPPPARSAPLPAPLMDAMEELARADAGARGAVYTRREVVEFVLDLVGYTSDRPLFELSLLEPAFGGGDFLLVAVERLLEAWRQHGAAASIRDMASCIRAVELHEGTFASTRARLLRHLRASGVGRADSAMLVAGWLVRGDFLLADLPPGFAIVVGNPPYVRQEHIPAALLAEYRARYRTMFDRADLYIPFIERSAKLLAEDGRAGLLCADRWVKNRYGGPLRRMLAADYHLHAYVDMVDTPAFQSKVAAYPAIFVIGRRRTGATRIARQPEISKPALAVLARQLTAKHAPEPGGAVRELAELGHGAEPWMLDASDRLDLMRRLERDFPEIEAAGCRVGIGVATGADTVFIAPYDALDVEDDRKLPLAMTRDLRSGGIRWQGLGIVNPFAESGALVDLARYPRMKRYLEMRRDRLAARHIARRMPAHWYRTIDRIDPVLAKTPKLLIPDIKGEAEMVHEPGRLYPHHNLYFVTSRHWDLRALRAILLSGIARLFVAAYSTPMRGGYLRFQAQYLRRVRLPHWAAVPPDTVDALIDAQARGDVQARNRAVFDLYGLTAAERAALDGRET